MADRPILLSSQFHSFHGMTPEQALSGYQKHVFGSERHIVSPEKVDEFHEWAYGRKRPRPWADEFSEMQATRTATPVDRQLSSWAFGHEGLAVGFDLYQKALDLKELTRAMGEHGESNPMRLYRGAERSAAVDAFPDRPLSFTTDHNVAFSFANTGGKRGQIIKAEPGTLRGLDFEKFGVNRRTVGRSSRRENEWLIDPTSFQTS